MLHYGVRSVHCIKLAVKCSILAYTELSIMYSIYLLTWRGTNLAYVGCTTRPNSRLESHGFVGSAFTNRISRGINTLPSMQILEETEDTNREGVWITRLWNTYELVNMGVNPHVKKRYDDTPLAEWVKKVNKTPPAPSPSITLKRARGDTNERRARALSLPSLL